MRFFPAFLALCAVVACSPEIPDSGAGVGFGDYGTFMRERERERLQQASAPRSIVPPPQVVSLPPQPVAPVTVAQGQPTTVQQGPIQQGPIQQAVLGQPMIPPGTIGGGAQPAPAAQIAPQPSQAADLPAGPRGQVTTQDFQAIAANQSGPASFPAPAQGQVQMVAAGAVPERPSDIPNIIEYALGTRHNVGERVWRRSPLTRQNTDRNCRGFVNSDLAQEEFLRRGGPERDPLNLDPDGDGFACWWDPAPFRAAAARASR